MRKNRIRRRERKLVTDRFNEAWFYDSLHPEVWKVVHMPLKTVYTNRAARDDANVIRYVPYGSSEPAPRDRFECEVYEV